MATRPRKAATRILTGDAEIDRALAEIAKVGTANRIARSGLGKAVRVMLKAMKAEVPSHAKDVKKALGGINKKNKRKHVHEAKVGAAVGVKQEKPRDREGKPGVGISAANVHWYVMGTDERFQKKTNRPTGKMPATPVVQAGYTKSKAQAQEALKQGIKVAMEREVEKAKRKAGL